MNEKRTQMDAWVLAGPTASGKTALSIRLAKAHACEIVCMDSMQIYRRMDIGTAKPTAEERAAVPHHLLDIADPGDAFSVSDYAAAAQEAAREIIAQGRRPLFVGGTGFYLRALRQDLTLGSTGADPALRERLEEEAAAPGGKEALWERLRAADPVTAERLHRNDSRRVIRALEVLAVTGEPLSAQHAEPDSGPFRCRVAVLNMDRERLYERIDRRVTQMLEQGLEAEVSGLLASGVSPTCQAMQGIGYKEWLPYFAGERTAAETAALIRQNTRHYAKRQLTWFRREPGACWTDALSPDAGERLAEFFTRGVET